MKNLYLLPLISIVLISCNSGEPVSPRFNHVVLQVSDMEKSVEFYTTAFDLQVTNDSIRHVVYTLADGSKPEKDLKVVLLKFPGQDFVFELSEVSNMDTAVKFALFHHIGIDVKNIDKAFQRAEAAGAEIYVPVRTVKTNGIETKQAFLKGPDGEMIELMQIISGEF